VCLAAEQLNQFKSFEGMKLVRVSESDHTPLNIAKFTSSNIESKDLSDQNMPKNWLVYLDTDMDQCPAYMLKQAEDSKKTHLLKFLQTKAKTKQYLYNNHDIDNIIQKLIALNTQNQSNSIPNKNSIINYNENNFNKSYTPPGQNDFDNKTQ